MLYNKQFLRFARATNSFDKNRERTHERFKTEPGHKNQTWHTHILGIGKNKCSKKEKIQNQRQ